MGEAVMKPGAGAADDNQGDAYEDDDEEDVTDAAEDEGDIVVADSADVAPPLGSGVGLTLPPPVLG